MDVSYLNMDRNNFVIHNSVKLFENSTGKQSNDPGYGFKYTNPNMFAIATSVPPAAVQGGGRRVGPSINLYLIDGVTGSLISQMNHPNSVPPVTMLSVENFLLYHYLNIKHMKHQFGVWQLYENKLETSSHPVVEGMAQTLMGTKAAPRSSFAEPAPLVSRHIYTYPTALNCLSTSVTTKGITTKMILAGTALGQVIGVLLPQFENEKLTTVVHPSESVLTYNRTIHHLHRIRASPSYLESTSHLVALGLDLFYTRVSPAKSYDLLVHSTALAP